MVEGEAVNPKAYPLADAAVSFCFERWMFLVLALHMSGLLTGAVLCSFQTQSWTSSSRLQTTSSCGKELTKVTNSVVEKNCCFSFAYIFIC